MNMSRALGGACLVLAALAGPRPAWGQIGLPGLVDPTTPIETAHLRVTVAGIEKPVPPGGRVSLALEVEPKEKMHVYAPGQKQYLPVSLQLERSPRIVARPPVYPKGEPVLFTATGETQIVYSHPFRIEVPVTIAAGGAAGPLVVSGTFEYQACDDRVCYAPKKVAVTWPLTVR